jgi:CTP synthase (UTP-ammonia lyase)
MSGHTNKRIIEDENITIDRERKRTKTSKARVRIVEAQIKSALLEWRLRTKRTHYPTCAFSAAGILPDFVIAKVSTNANITTMEDLLSCCGETWIYAVDHGHEVLEIVNQLERDHSSELAARKEEKKRQTALKNEQKRIAAAAERERKRQQVAWARSMTKLPSAHPHTPISTHTTPYPHPSPAPHPLLTSPLPLTGSFVFNIVTQAQTDRPPNLGKALF